MTELQPGEWLLACARCGWQLEKNTAAKTQCPECDARDLVIVTNKSQATVKDAKVLVTRERAR